MILDYYGDGADCNKHSRCVWMHDYISTHRVVCRIHKNGDALKFIQFVGLDELGRHKVIAPFTHVECADYVFVAVDDCDFELERLSPQS